MPPARLLCICDTRGEEALQRLREAASSLAPAPCFIEGTEFDVQEARSSALDGKPICQQAERFARHYGCAAPSAKPDVGHANTSSGRAGARAAARQACRPHGAARALLAMFGLAEVHPFADGNGRLARLVMNAEPTAVGACRIIIPTLFRQEYLDCLRVLSRAHDPLPFIAAMQKIHAWTAAFDDASINQVIASMQRCNAFERSRVQFELLPPNGML